MRNALEFLLLIESNCLAAKDRREKFGDGAI